MDLFGNNWFRDAYTESDKLAAVFRQRAEDNHEESAECRYRAIVMTLLPVICSRVRAIFFFCGSVIGFLFGLLLSRWL